MDELVFNRASGLTDLRQQLWLFGLTKLSHGSDQGECGQGFTLRVVQWNCQPTDTALKFAVRLVIALPPDSGQAGAKLIPA